jgi:hypothetical protein
MPKVIIDTSGVPEGNFQPYDGPIPPKGLYKAVWKRGWWTKSSTDKPMIKLLFVLETDNAQKKQFNGCPLFHNITYEASTMWKMKELFNALNAGAKAGIDYDDKGDVKRIGRAQPGKTFLLIHSDVGSWKGQARAEISALAPLPRAEGEEEVESFEDDGEEATAFEDAQGVDMSAGDEFSGEDMGDPWATPSGGIPEQTDEPPF